MATATIGQLTLAASALDTDIMEFEIALSGLSRKITKKNFIGATLTGLGTIATGGFALVVAANSTINGSLVGNISGGGTLATGGFTLTIPAAGTASIRGLIVGARVYNDANISVANATVQPLTFNSERFDTDALHSTSVNTGRLTAPVTGTYLIFAAATFAANATGQRVLQLRLNGTTFISRVGDVSTSANLSALETSTIYQLTAGDYIEAIVYQDSGGALNVSATANYSPEFAMVLLSS